MIIMNIIGGLGNQLFQYALGRTLSILHHVEFKIDNLGFVNYMYGYGLHSFNIHGSIATKQEIMDFKGRNPIHRQYIKWKNAQRPYYQRSIIQERHFHFDEMMHKVSSGYLQGYWQSEKYFSVVEQEIRRDLTFRQEPDEKNKRILESIRTVNSVSLHIRRGDYVTNTTTNQVHGVMPLEYYQRAIKIISQQVDEPSFYVFSDDPQWAQDNLKLEYPVEFVAHNHGDKSYEDLRLMGNCKHNIIANSTFSWWGAWLNNNPNKLVIAPDRWFNNSPHNTKDLIPARWIKV